MGQKEESRLRKRSLIIRKTRNLIAEKGIVNLPTIEIAKACDISHGSIFQHFVTRDNLFKSIADVMINRIIVRFQINTKGINDIDILLDSFLNRLSYESKVLGVFYREMFLLDKEIQLSINEMEKVFRKPYYEILKNKNYDEEQIKFGLDIFFITIIHYIAYGGTYDSDDIFSDKKEELHKLFNILFPKE